MAPGGVEDDPIDDGHDPMGEGRPIGSDPHRDDVADRQGRRIDGLDFFTAPLKPNECCMQL